MIKHKAHFAEISAFWLTAPGIESLVNQGGSLSLHKKRSFSLRISLVNVMKFRGNGGFGHIY